MRIGVVALLVSGCLSKPPAPTGAGPPDGGMPGDHYDAVTLGARHVCAIDHGAVYCWGDSALGQASASGDLTSPARVGDASVAWTAVAAGGTSTCGIHDGMVECWGDNTAGQVVGAPGGSFPMPVPPGFEGTPPAFERIAVGGVHACAVGAGQLWCWGGSDQIGTTSNRAIQLADSAWTEISTGVAHSCGISGGTVECFGQNFHGESLPGDGGLVVSPTAVPLMQPALHVAAGNQQSCAIIGAANATEGELWCWGDNSDQLLGPTTAPSMLPTQVGTAATWSAISLTVQRACGIRGGHAVCWGTELVGGLGDGVWQEFLDVDHASDLGAADAAVVGIPSPTSAEGPTEVGCRLAAGTISCWGDTPHGELALGTATRHPTPVAIPAPVGHPWQHVWAGYEHTCAATDSELDCWGADSLGQVSAGTGQGGAVPCTTTHCDVATPMVAPKSDIPATLIAGNEFTCTLLESGTVWCWGDNSDGQLGAPGPGHAVRQVAGSWHPPVNGGPRAACALDDASEPKCWGSIAGVPSAMPTQVDPSLAIGLAFGDAFGCGIDLQGDRTCWGDNSDAQLGSTDLVTYAMPTVFETGHVMSQIAAAGKHACEIDTMDGVKCWGDSSAGESGVVPSGTPEKDPQLVLGSSVGCGQLALGQTYSCALCGGAVQCWGDDSDANLGRGGDTTTPPQIPTLVMLDAGPYVEVAAGNTHACALRQDHQLFCWGWGPHGQIGDGGHAVSIPAAISARQ